VREFANKGGRRAVGALMLKTRRSVSLQFAALTLLSILLACCATPKDLQHHVIISVKDQKLALLDRERLVAIYPVSTSKYGLGDWPSSRCTPLGELEIAEKIGDNAPLGTVFKGAAALARLFCPMLRGAIQSLPASSGCAAGKRKTRMRLGAIFIFM